MRIGQVVYWDQPCAHIRGDTLYDTAICTGRVLSFDDAVAWVLPLDREADGPFLVSRSSLYTDPKGGVIA